MMVKECSRTGCCGEYLNLRGKKCQEDRKNDIMRSSVICGLRIISFRSFIQGGIDDQEL
jgi:hypothetical protein